MIIANSALAYVQLRTKQQKDVECRRRDELSSMRRHAEYLDSMISEGMARIDSARDRGLFELRIQIGSLQSERKRLKRTILELEQALLGMSEVGFRSEFAYMRQIPQVHSVSLIRVASRRSWYSWHKIEELYLHIKTQTLFSRSTKHRSWHRIGRFDIRAPMEVGTRTSHTEIRWRNVDGEIRAGSCSPNGISSQGSVACLGNAREKIVSAYAMYDYPLLVSILVRFPEVDVKDSSCAWPRVEECDVPSWYLGTASA